MELALAQTAKNVFTVPCGSVGVVERNDATIRVLQYFQVVEHYPAFLQPGIERFASVHLLLLCG